MSQQTPAETTVAITDVPAPRRSITLRVPPVKKIAIASLTAVGAVVVAKAVASKLHRGEDASVENDEVSEVSEI